jgi:hypothetical protein
MIGLAGRTVIRRDVARLATKGIQAATAASVTTTMMDLMMMIAIVADAQDIKTGS